MTKDTELQRHLRAAGLSQTELAGMLGVAVNTIHRQAVGALPLAKYVLGFVTAWRLLPADLRAQWIAEMRAAFPEASAPPEKPAPEPIPAAPAPKPAPPPKAPATKPPQQVRWSGLKKK